VRFTNQTPETAPEKSKELLKKVLDKFGFIPNQDKILAIAPSIYQSYNQSFDLFLGKSSLGLLEGQIVIMTASYENNSPYCIAVHTWGMEMTKVPKDIIEALRTGKPINDSRLETLRNFTKKLMTKRGHVDEKELNDFYNAGFTQENVIEIIGGLSTKMISNYTNVVAKTELDELMKPYEWVKE
jgi:alkylhydroperoxidase family enzyme